MVSVGSEQTRERTERGVAMGRRLEHLCVAYTRAWRTNPPRIPVATPSSNLPILAASDASRPPNLRVTLWPVRVQPP